MRKIILLSLALCLLGTSCAVNPVTGRKELSLISEKEEIQLGQQTDGEVKSQYGVVEDLKLVDYVQTVGRRLVPHTHRPNLNYQFAVLDTPVINAFAVPGGYIYVTRGILALMGSEAELAVVLGHELGHVNARHTVRRMSQILLVQLGLAVGSALSDAFAKISGLAGIGAQILFLKYSRDDERQADALGIEYSRRGSYSPAEMMGFFDALQKMGDLSGGYTLPGFLSTHPLNSERIRNVQLQLAEGDDRLAINKEEYLRRIDGMIYGDDPRQGYVEETAFYHPHLRFFFNVPDGWEVQNTPAQVTLSEKKGNAAVVLQAEKSGESLSVYAQKKAQSLEGRQFVQERNASFNGLAAFEQIYDIPQQDKETLRVRLSFIRKGDYIYTFSSLSTALNFKTYDAAFQRVVNSFRELTDSRYLNRQPSRLRLIRADGRQTLEEMFKQAGMKKEIWPRFAVLNGLKTADTPAKDQWLKIAR